MTTPLKRVSRLQEALDKVEGLLKESEVASNLSEAGVNASLALVAVDGLRAYLLGKKKQAIEDLETVIEEIRARMVQQAPPDGH